MHHAKNQKSAAKISSAERDRRCVRIETYAASGTIAARGGDMHEAARSMWPRVALAAAALLACAGPARAAAAPGDADFDADVDRYYAGYAAARPVDATQLGIHTHDGELGDWSAEGVERQRAWLRDF